MNTPKTPQSSDHDQTSFPPFPVENPGRYPHSTPPKSEEQVTTADIPSRPSQPEITDDRCHDDGTLGDKTQAGFAGDESLSDRHQAEAKRRQTQSLSQQRSELEWRTEQFVAASRQIRGGWARVVRSRRGPLRGHARLRRSGVPHSSRPYVLVRRPRRFGTDGL